jgi:hypothetical protein
VPSYVLRIWMADRPGALGAVAGRIGAVGGDVVGIDILERDQGRVIDELTIELPDDELVPLMVSKLAELDAVDVEDVRHVAAGSPHLALDPLEVAADLLHEHVIADLFGGLVKGVAGAFGADWAAVVDPSGPTVMSALPGSPTTPWLEAFVAGARCATPDPRAAASATDVAWASLEICGCALLAGRAGRPFRARERRQLVTLGRVADHRWYELVTLEAMRAHPARSR